MTNLESWATIGSRFQFDKVRLILSKNEKSDVGNDTRLTI
jgi:hypothetical protein